MDHVMSSGQGPLHIQLFGRMKSPGQSVLRDLGAKNILCTDFCWHIMYRFLLAHIKLVCSECWSIYFSTEKKDMFITKPSNFG